MVCCLRSPTTIDHGKRRGEEVKLKFRERERKDRNAPRSNPKQKQKIKLTKLQWTHKVRGQGLDKTGYDPKYVDEFGESWDNLRNNFSL